MGLPKKFLKEKKKVFKNWGEAKKHNAVLLHLAEGAVTAVMKITEDDLTPHATDTNVVFGGNHFMLANMAGALGVIALLDEDEEPLLVSGKIEFMEPALIEEKFLQARAIICPEYTEDKNGKTRKKFSVFVDLTNAEGRIKACAELNYSAKPYRLHKKNIDELRKYAKEASEKERKRK